MNSSTRTAELIVRTFEVLVNTCGVVCIEDAYEQFKEWFPKEAKEVDFAEDMWDDALVMTRGKEYPEFGQWMFDRKEYAIHAVLHYDLTHTPEGELLPADEAGNPGYSPEVEGYLRNLVDCHNMTGRQSLPKDLVTRGFFEWCLDLDEVADMNAFLGAHATGDEDPQKLADQMTVMLIGGHQGMADASDLVYNLGHMGLDEEQVGSKELLDLLMQMFNALPAWNNNGISAAEMHARSKEATE